MARRRKRRSRQVQQREDTVTRWENWLGRVKRRPVVYFAVTMLVLLSGLVGLLSNALTVVTGFDQITETEVTATINPIETRHDDEFLILIAPFFHSDGVIDTEPHNEIRRAIESRAREYSLEDLRIEVLDGSMRAIDIDAAQMVGEKYDASIVIWGENTGVRITTSLINRNPESFDLGNPLIPEHVEITETARTQLSNSPIYGDFITNDLPNELAFISLLVIGQYHFYTRQHDRSVEIVEQAIGSAPENILESSMLQSAHRMLGLIHQYTYADYAAAAEEYQKAITIDPDNYLLYFELGTAFSDAFLYDSAIEAYGDAIDRNRFDHKSLYNRGNAYMALGQYQTAILDYTSAIAIKSDYSRAYAQRGLALRNQGDLVAALVDFELALQYSSPDLNTSAVHGNLASIHQENGDYDMALASYTQAIRENPLNAVAYYRRGILRDNHFGDLTGALADFDSALALEPDQALLHFSRAVTLERMGNVTESMLAYSRTLELDSTIAWARNNRGNLYIQQNDLAAAINDFDQAIFIDPSYALAYFNRARAYYLLGDTLNATLDLQSAHRIGDDPELQLQIEDLLEEISSQ